MIITAQNPSSSNPNKRYTVAFDTTTSEASCDCPGWTFKKGDQPRTCKHTVAILKQHGLTANTSSDTVVTIPTTAIPQTTPPVVSPAPIIPIPPMLASALPAGNTIQDYLNDEWVLQEKIDGHRMIVTITQNSVTAFTRQTASHVSNHRKLPTHIQNFALKLPPGVYDAELFIPKGTSSDVVRVDRQSELVLAIFDLVIADGVSLLQLPLAVRMPLLQMAAASAGLTDTTPIRLVKTVPVSTTALDAIWASGGEGVILKRLDSVYISGFRSLDWVKIKKLLSATLTIVGFTKGKLGPFSIVNLRDTDGNETSVKTLNNATLKEIDTKGPASFLGRKLVIEHQGRTAKGVYRHPTWDHLL